MIIAKSKPLAPGQEDLVMTLDCRVSYFWGAKALSFFVICGIWATMIMPLVNWMDKSLHLSSKSWPVLLVVLGLSLVFWLIYNALWKRSVTIYDRGQSLEILINHKLYRYDWLACVVSRLSSHPNVMVESSARRQSSNFMAAAST